MILRIIFFHSFPFFLLSKKVNDACIGIPDRRGRMEIFESSRVFFISRVVVHSSNVLNGKNRDRRGETS